MARIASVLQTQDGGKKNLALPAFQISCRWSREKNKANVVDDLDLELTLQACGQERVAERKGLIVVGTLGSADI